MFVLKSTAKFFKFVSPKPDILKYVHLNIKLKIKCYENKLFSHSLDSYKVATQCAYWKYRDVISDFLKCMYYNC